MLITFENSLDPDQDQENVSSNLDPNFLTLIRFLLVFFRKRPEKYPACELIMHSQLSRGAKGPKFWFEPFTYIGSLHKT